MSSKEHKILSLINQSINLKQLKQVHTKLITTGYFQNPNSLSQFVSTLALENPKNINYTDKVLNGESQKNPSLFAFNSLIRAHSKGSNPHKAFDIFKRILNSGCDIAPDNYTFNFLVRACAQIPEHGAGPVVHCVALKLGFDKDPHVECGLIFMYGELGCLGACRQVFDLIPEPDLVCRTVMVSACAKCGDLDFARGLFDLMLKRDSVAWSAMIAGYMQWGRSREALLLFHLMQVEGVKVNEVTMVSVLSACSHLGALDHGRWAHAYIERNKIPMTVTLGTALIDMYAKCGDKSRAMAVFWSMKEKNVYTWSSAMNGMAMNGEADKCLDLFSLMRKDGIVPNDVTFISVLKACGTIGQVEKGQEYFDSMRREYGLKPRVEHYGCMVDLYGRAGKLEAALDVINNMPMKPHGGAWGALLNACKLHNNMELGEFASKQLIELEGENHGAYVILSNMYVDSMNWEKSHNVRKAMKDKGVKKQPGCSAIEVDGEVHEFFCW